MHELGIVFYIIKDVKKVAEENEGIKLFLWYNLKSVSEIDGLSLILLNIKCRHVEYCL